jgi:hypothetical protein
VRQTVRYSIMACIWIATVFHANDAAAAQRQSVAVRDNKADFQRRSGIQIVRRPDRPFIERRNGQQLINFDLFIRMLGQRHTTLSQSNSRYSTVATISNSSVSLMRMEDLLLST